MLHCGRKWARLCQRFPVSTSARFRLPARLGVHKVEWRKLASMHGGCRPPAMSISKRGKAMPPPVCPPPAPARVPLRE